MTRKEIEESYEVKDGRICSPGKFEGEVIYAPYFWAFGLEGWADRDDGKVYGFDIHPDDRAEFPEIPADRRTINLDEADQGFVHTDH
jgi:hypothetical protein